MAFDVFISYSSKDKAAADAACAALEGAGVRCWIAPRDIRPGGEYGGAIIEAIDHCRVMVLIFSSNANASQQILREIERAVSKVATIVPMRIEEVTPTKSMAYFLGAIHWLDALTPPIEQHLRQLADTVKAILQADTTLGASTNGKLGQSPREADRSASRPETAAASSSRTSARSKWLLGAVAAVIGVVVLGGGVWLYDRMQPIAPAPPRQTEALVPETIPFISDSLRASIRNTYLPAPDYKAIAIYHGGRFVTGQKDIESAKKAALDSCKRGSADGARYCQLYAIGDVVVYSGARPTLPPEPWLVRDSSTEKPLVIKDIPLLPLGQRTALDRGYQPLRAPSKAIAIALNAYAFFGGANTDEAVRRSLEWCSFLSGASCLVAAVDNVFVVPIPTTMKATGLFRAASNAAIASEVRADVARRLANATSGWNVVAAGGNGRPGLGLRAANEQEGIDRALADCNRQDRGCRVIAIGPFAVEPQSPGAPQ
jgi:hypothetical protein